MANPIKINNLIAGFVENIKVASPTGDLPQPDANNSAQKQAEVKPSKKLPEERYKIVVHYLNNPNFGYKNFGSYIRNNIYAGTEFESILEACNYWCMKNAHKAKSIRLYDNWDLITVKGQIQGRVITEWIDGIKEIEFGKHIKHTHRPGR